MATEEQAREIKGRHAFRLLQTKGVSGVGIERDAAGDYFLAIHVDSGDPQLAASLPKQIEGLEVRIVPSGPFRKL